MDENQVLEKVEKLSKDGQVELEWRELKPALIGILSRNLDTIVDPQLKTDEYRKEVEKVYRMFEELENVPWTVQRLAELVLKPASNYSNILKYLHALQRILSVVSTPDFYVSPGLSDMKQFGISPFLRSFETAQTQSQR